MILDGGPGNGVETGVLPWYGTGIRLWLDFCCMFYVVRYAFFQLSSVGLFRLGMEVDSIVSEVQSGNEACSLRQGYRRYHCG